ncbi:MAG: hypothetical protein KDC98_06670 [Planctomycetes bacterium]|nr:hypothetical protein [Planctomycetota bacterium]
MSLLRADLRSLANLPLDAVGRRLLLHALFGLGLLAFLSWWIADHLLTHPALLRMAHSRGAASLPGMLGIGLMPCPVAATWLGLSVAQRQLFDSPELPLWQSAPIAAFRGPIQILLRSGFLAVVWATALSLPFVFAVLSQTTATWTAFVAVPFAIVTATVPLMATLLVVQIVLIRLFAGRVMRLLLTALGAAATVGFSTWLLLVLFTGGEHADRILDTVGAPESLPWTVDAGAQLLTAIANGTFALVALRSCIWWLLFAATLFWLGARLHAGALQAHLLAEPPLRRRRSSWPNGIAATFRRKEIAQLLQQPGALISFLIFAFLVFVLVDKQVMVGPVLGDYRLPLPLRHLGAMLAQWFLATLLVLYPHMGRLVIWDANQWTLYQSAPASPRAILRGKLEAVGILLLWPLLLVAAVSSHATGASPRTLMLFGALALPGILIALGALALIGTTPWLVRPDEGRQLAQGGRNFFASLLLITVFELLMSPAFYLWMELSSWAHDNDLSPELVQRWTPWVIAGTWLAGLAVFGLGLAIGGRNFRRLTTPR